MVKKQKTKDEDMKKKKVPTKAVKATKKLCKKTTLFRSTSVDLKQLGNYKEFIKYLLCVDDDDVDCESVN